MFDRVDDEMGGGAHSPEEYLDLATLPDRVALVASLIAETIRRAP